MKKKLVIALVVIVLGALGAWKIAGRVPFSYAGTIEATEVDVSARISGVLSHVYVKEGDAVTKDQALIDLDCDDLRLSVSIADKDFKRAQTLKQAGSMPEETFDRLRFRHDDALLKVSWCQIASPLSGVVLDRYHEPGEFVAPGMKILTLADLNEVWTTIYVPESVMSALTLGQAVSAYNPSGDFYVPGKVIHIRDEAEFTPKNVQTREERTRLVYGIKVSFENNDRRLKPGMTIEITVEKQ